MTKSWIVCIIKINSVICRNKRYRMDKEKNIAEEIKTKDDIKSSFGE